MKVNLERIKALNPCSDRLAASATYAAAYDATTRTLEEAKQLKIILAVMREMSRSTKKKGKKL